MSSDRCGGGGVELGEHGDDPEEPGELVDVFGGVFLDNVHFAVLLRDLHLLQEVGKCEVRICGRWSCAARSA